MDFDARVTTILTNPAIKRKLVVLCEGQHIGPDPDDGEGSGGSRDRHARSPQTYRRHDHLPDASFYKKCIPRSWHNDRLPCFFNCGGRSTVLSVYTELLERHHTNPVNSYLDPDKLYALVDLDIQQEATPAGYPWMSTEEIHRALYDAGRVDTAIDCIDARHRIWVTAMVHKEAYFILPPAHNALFQHHVCPTLNGKPLTLEAICAQAIAHITPGHADIAQDLETKFSTIAARLDAFRDQLQLSDSDCSDLVTVVASITAAHSNTNYDQPACAELILAIFQFAKAKPIWERIVPDPDDPNWTHSAAVYREDLALKIADEIAKLEGSGHPLASFIEFLKARR